MTDKFTLLRHLERNESVLKALRDACRGTPLFEDSSLSFVHMRCRMDHLFLKDEGTWKWQEFHHRYYDEAKEGRSQGAPIGSSAYFYARAPEWVRWKTDNRQAYAEHLPGILEALRGLPVSVQEDFGWTWLRGAESQRPDGKAQYKKNFGLLLSYYDREKFDPDALLAKRSSICRATDPRADRCIFEYLHDAGHFIGDGGYTWTAKGFKARVWAKKQAEKLQKVFADCATKMEGEQTKHGKAWTVMVDFPH